MQRTQRSDSRAERGASTRPKHKPRLKVQATSADAVTVAKRAPRAKAPRLKIKARTVVKGDARCLSIAAASIIAKVTRDRIMIEQGKVFSAYGFERHKGYGTREHQDAIARHGVCALHRRSFKPIQLAMQLALTPAAE